MTNQIEMQNLSEKPAVSDVPEVNEAPFEPPADTTVQVWGVAAAIWLVSLSVPLLLFPRFLLFLAAGTQEPAAALSPLESFLASHFGLLLIALAAGTVMATPSSSYVSEHRVSSQGHPLLVPITLVAGISSFMGYNTKSAGTLGFLVFLGNGLISAWGFWVMLFAGTSNYSRKTGADKHTSSFIFSNKTAASVQKKEWRKRQKQT